MADRLKLETLLNLVTELREDKEGKLLSEGGSKGRWRGERGVLPQLK